MTQQDQEGRGIPRPTTHPTIQILSPELARELQANDFTRPTRYSVEFAIMVSHIAEWDGHPTSAEMGDAA